MSKPRQTRGGHVLLGADGDAARLMTPDAGEEPYSFWGFTDHFEIYLAHNLFTSGVDGVLTASAIKDRCEDDYNRLQHLFSGVDIDDLPFQIHLRPGKHGGTHDGCDSTSIYCDVDPNDNDNFIRFELVAEVAEVFMDAVGKGWDCSRSNGEGLSRVLAADAYPQPQQTSLGIPGFFTAWSWLNGPRLNFVNQNDQSDQNYPSIGCAALFLNYLRFQLGFSWRQIVRSDGQFLVGAFNLLTGRTDAFDSFSSLVARRFPVGGNADLATDNPFPIRPDLLFYDAAGGVGQFYASDMSGDITLLSTYTDWRTTWTSIVPLHFTRGRHADLVFYNAHAGYAELYSTNGAGELTPLVRQYTDWGTTWSIILAGNFSGHQFSDLLFYDRGAGTGEFYTTDRHGNLSLLRQHTDWRTTWSQIVVGNFSRSDFSDLLFYDPVEGVLEFWTVDVWGHVALLRNVPTSRTWTTILALNVTGGIFSDLLFYDAAAGIGQLSTIDGDGNLHLLKAFTGWRTNWSVIRSPSFGQLMFYSADSGVGEFYSVYSSTGTLTLQQTHADWRTDWSQIQVANFADQI